MRAIDRMNRRAAAAAASAQPRGVLKRNDAGELVPLDPAAAATAPAAGGAADTAATPAEARSVREIDGQGWAR